MAFEGLNGIQIIRVNMVAHLLLEKDHITICFLSSLKICQMKIKSSGQKSDVCRIVFADLSY